MRERVAEGRERASMAETRLIKHAKALRKNMTDAEQRLWYHLRAHRFLGAKFKRQKPIGPYIVDFVCMESRLAIELDGGQHAEDTEYDQRRDAWLATNGYTVLRFWNNQVMQELPEVLERIREALVATPSPPALPLAGEGRETEPDSVAGLPFEENPISARRRRREHQ
jgi:very-short-patch-repair endonuclease